MKDGGVCLGKADFPTLLPPEVQTFLLITTTGTCRSFVRQRTKMFETKNLKKLEKCLWIDFRGIFYGIKVG